MKEEEFESTVSRLESEIKASFSESFSEFAMSDLKWQTSEYLAKQARESLFSSYFPFHEETTHSFVTSADKPLKEEDPYESMSEAERAAIFEWNDD